MNLNEKVPVYFMVVKSSLMTSINMKFITTKQKKHFKEGTSKDTIDFTSFLTLGLTDKLLTDVVFHEEGNC